MGRKRVEIEAADIHGCKYFKLIPELLKSLHDVGTARDKAGNREFFCDQYVSLLLLYFFSPVVTSLNGLQAATGLDKVQKLLGIKRVSMGTLSESARLLCRTLFVNVLDVPCRSRAVVKPRLCRD